MDRPSFQTEQTKCSGSEEGKGGVERPPGLERMVGSSRTWGLNCGDPINQTKELGFDCVRNGGEGRWTNLNPGASGNFLANVIVCY